MDTVSQKLDEVLHALAYEKVEGVASDVDSDPLLNQDSVYDKSSLTWGITPYYPNSIAGVVIEENDVEYDFSSEIFMVPSRRRNLRGSNKTSPVGARRVAAVGIQGSHHRALYLPLILTVALVILVYSPRVLGHVILAQRNPVPQKSLVVDSRLFRRL